MDGIETKLLFFSKKESFFCCIELFLIVKETWYVTYLNYEVNMWRIIFVSLIYVIRFLVRELLSISTVFSTVILQMN